MLKATSHRVPGLRKCSTSAGKTSGQNGVVEYTMVPGAYFGPQFGGKGFVRLFVYSAEPATELARPENIVILKTSDTKASALLPGDIVTFKCRAQYEAVAAVRNAETFNKEALETWELDYCRMISPLITVK